MSTTAATMEPISSRLRHDEKETFVATCDSIGTSPSNAIRMFVSAFNKRGGFPFDPANPLRLLEGDPFRDGRRGVREKSVRSV